ncbi:MAG: oligosaccharide flippase family protein [Pirellulales bacterium]
MSDSTDPIRTPPAHTSGITTVRRVAVNVMSLLTSDVLNKAATFVVYAMVGRCCGPRSFGQLSLGLLLLYTFQVFAAAGLPTLITRDVSKHRDLSGRYFVNACVITLGAFVLSLAALMGCVEVSGYPQDTSVIILLLGLGILPWSLATITESILRAWERMHVMMLVAIPVNLLRVGGCYGLLAAGHGVQSVAVLLLGCHLVTLLLEWLLLLRYVPLRDVSIDLAFCRDLLRGTWRFLGIDSLIALWGCINTVLLSWFSGEAAVGLFGAAWQLLIPVRMTLQAIVSSLFPIMCRRAEESRVRLQQITALTLEILAFITVPSCILLYFAAGPIISVIYGDQGFASSVLVLRIMVPVLLLQAVTSTLGQVLYSQRREHVTLRIVAIDVVFNLLVGIPLIYAFGLMGAAVSILLAWALNGLLHVLATRDCLAVDVGDRGRWKATLIWPVVAAGSAMAIAQAASKDLNVLVMSLVASSVYVVVLAAFVYAACRGTLGFRERFLLPLRETAT